MKNTQAITVIAPNKEMTQIQEGLNQVASAGISLFLKWVTKKIQSV